MFALLVLAAASGAACAAPPPPPLWTESAERAARRAHADATVVATAPTAAATKFPSPPPTTTTNKNTRGLGTKDVVTTVARRNGTTGYMQSLKSALSGCVVDVVKLKLDTGTFEASCLGVGFFFQMSQEPRPPARGSNQQTPSFISKNKNLHVPHTSPRGGATGLGLATFHNVISQSKHKLMTASMVHVTNMTL
jgi:hypothetical protein